NASANAPPPPENSTPPPGDDGTTGAAPPPSEEPPAEPPKPVPPVPADARGMRLVRFLETVPAGSPWAPSSGRAVFLGHQYATDGSHGPELVATDEEDTIHGIYAGPVPSGSTAYVVNFGSLWYVLCGSCHF